MNGFLWKWSDFGKMGQSWLDQRKLERGPAGRDTANGERAVMKPLDYKITLVVHNTLGDLQTV